MPPNKGYDSTVASSVSMRAVAALAVLLIGAGLAGCADEAPPPAPVAAPPTSALGLEGLASPDSLADTKGWLLEGAVAPEGAVTGGLWTIPSGALTEDDFFDDWEWLRIEVLPVAAPGTTVEDLSLLVFDVGRTGSLIAAHLAPTFQTRQRLDVPIVSVVAPQGGLAPFFLELGPEPPEEGDTLGFVLTAKGSAGNVGVLLRLTHEDVFSEMASSEPSDYLPAQVIPEQGSGRGSNTAVYMELASLVVLGYEVQSTDLLREERLPVDLRPALTARDTTLGSSFPASAWHYSDGVFLGYEAHGTWDAVDTNPWAALDTGSLIAQDFAVPGASTAEFLAVGLPFFVVTGGGKPASVDARFDVLVTNVDELLIFEFVSLDLGVGLETLLGVQPMAFAGDFTALVPDVDPPLVDAAGNNLRWVGPGGVRFSMALPPLES